MNHFISFGIVFFYTLNCFSMEQQQLFKKAELPEELQIRTAMTARYIKNIEKIVSKNGFNKADKIHLDEIKSSLQETDVTGPAFRDFYKLARFGTILLEEIADNETFNAQVFCVGYFCLTAAKDKVKKQSSANETNQKKPRKKVKFSETTIALEETTKPILQGPHVLEDEVL